MKKENSQLHIRIDEPVELRKGILESAIDVAESLKLYEGVKAIKRNKNLYKKALKTRVKELRTAVERLEKNLPKVSTDEPKQKQAVGPKESEPTKRIRLVGPKSKLETDLEEIRAKLNKL